MLGKDVDDNKKYTASYEFVHFATGPYVNGILVPTQERKIFMVEKAWSGYPNDIILAVKNYMGHYGAIQGQLIGEFNEITN